MKKNVLALAALVAILSACGGGGGDGPAGSPNSGLTGGATGTTGGAGTGGNTGGADPATPPASQTGKLAVVPSLGKLSGVTVSIRPIASPGAFVATAALGADGVATLEIPKDFCRPAVVEVKAAAAGATFFNETTGKDETLPIGALLRNYVACPANESAVGVSAITELGYLRGIGQHGYPIQWDGSAETAADLAKGMEDARLAFAPDAASLTVAPIVVAAPADLATLPDTPAGRMAVRLAAFADATQPLASGSGVSTLLAALSEMKADFIDGKLDTYASTTFNVRRFGQAYDARVRQRAGDSPALAAYSTSAAATPRPMDPLLVDGGIDRLVDALAFQDILASLHGSRKVYQNLAAPGFPIGGSNTDIVAFAAKLAASPAAQSWSCIGQKGSSTFQTSADGTTISETFTDCPTSFTMLNRPLVVSGSITTTLTPRATALPATGAPIIAGMLAADGQATVDLTLTDPARPWFRKSYRGAVALLGDLLVPAANDLRLEDVDASYRKPANWIVGGQVISTLAGFDSATIGLADAYQTGNLLPQPVRQMGAIAQRLNGSASGGSPGSPSGTISAPTPFAFGSAIDPTVQYAMLGAMSGSLSLAATDGGERRVDATGTSSVKISGQNAGGQAVSAVLPYADFITGFFY